MRLTELDLFYIDFCNVSGQTPNLAKSHILFSKNVAVISKNEVKSVFPVNELAPNSAWNIVTNKNPFLSSILKAKYYPNASFWTANSSSSTKSIFWSSIMQVKQILHKHCVLQIHGGDSSI